MTDNQVQAIITSYKSYYENRYWNEGLDDNTLSMYNWGTTDSIIGK